MSKPMFLIVGASLTGAKAAEELRSNGFDGRVMLVGAEPERPYERPPLTKDYLRGESERAKAYVHPDGYYEEQEIELVTGVTVTAIDPGAAQMTLDDGRILGYDRLLLATGAEPRRLNQGPAAARCSASRSGTTASRTSTPTSTTSGWSTPGTRRNGMR
jgi:3-phenylpropionate/trans-cinnamate dioxygenase ferredoxin reductase component